MCLCVCVYVCVHVHVCVYMCVCVCVCVCVVCGKIAKWSGNWPANRKVSGSIPAQDTLVLLFP